MLFSYLIRVKILSGFKTKRNTLPHDDIQKISLAYLGIFFAMVTIQHNPIEFQVKTASTNESFQIQLIVDRVEYPIAYFFITLGHWTSTN